MRELPSGERRILEILIGDYPRSVSHVALEEITGFAPRTRQDYLLRLRARELIVETARGESQASPELFD